MGSVMRYRCSALFLVALACTPVDLPPGGDDSDADTDAFDTDRSDTDGADTDGVDTDSADTDESDTDASDSDASDTDLSADTDLPDDTDLPIDTDDLVDPLVPRAGDLVIVEIQGNPVVAADDEAEYIELLNVSGRTLDLSGVVLAHVQFPGTGSAPVVSTDTHTISGTVTAGVGARILLTRSNGGYFGGATSSYVYDGVLMANGATISNRLRLYVPGWTDTEPPLASEVIDEVITPAGTFQNDWRGRSWQLDPDLVPSPTASNNDDPDNWCSTAEEASLAYWNANWGTPGQPNACD